MLDVFISYSRQDWNFVEVLAENLTQSGKQIWFDRSKEPLEGIVAGSSWWEQIKLGIEAADNFLFIISPRSMTSPYCNAEIAHAIHYKKRLVTVLLKNGETDGALIQEIDHTIDAINDDVELPVIISADIVNLQSLTRRNWNKIIAIQYVPFDLRGGFDYAFDQLINGVDLDLDWIRQWSQFRQAVQLWEENDYHAGYLWGEIRLLPLRQEIQKRNQILNETEVEFLKPEQERLADELNVITTTHNRRSQIGLRLAKLGDLRAGVGLRADGWPDIEWCEVPAGEIEVAKEVFTIPHFYIARYLITYSQFQAFVEAEDGFNQAQWWTDPSEDFQMQSLEAQQQPYANYPRDSISWFQAVAFTHWLNQTLPTDAYSTVDYKHWLIRLPNEWEWQWAASGGHSDYQYPWGAEWHENHANTHEAGLGRSTAVGMYPAGQAVCGALDIAGNIREWCFNEYTRIKSRPKPHTLGAGVLRGGAFENPSSYARLTSRYANHPERHRQSSGLRVICVPPE